MKKRIPNSEYEKVLDTFEKYYVLVPLEVFADPFEILVSTIMSARTNDDTTLPAAKRLFKKAHTIDQLLQLDESEIAKLIFPVGFYKTKAKNILKMAQQVKETFEGKIPDTREELESLAGVGRKTANLTLNRAFKKPAIAVDTHVHKITNWLGWVDTKTPLETERELSKTVPQKYWTDMNRLFVSIGRQFRTEKRIKEFLRENDLL